MLCVREMAFRMGSSSRRSDTWLMRTARAGGGGLGEAERGWLPRTGSADRSGKLLNMGSDRPVKLKTGRGTSSGAPATGEREAIGRSTCKKAFELTCVLPQ